MSYSRLPVIYGSDVILPTFVRNSYVSRCSNFTGLNLSDEIRSDLIEEEFRDRASEVLEWIIH